MSVTDSSPATAVAPNAPGQISASALKQITALETEKSRRTPAQQKIDSQLLYADKMRRGEPIADGVASLDVKLERDDQGRPLVDIKADVTDELLQEIGELGGNVINSFPQYHAIRAAVPLSVIEILAARADIQFIGPAVGAQRSAVDPEGDVTHQANIARALYGVNGTGVKVGVLSDSVTYLATVQSNGSLPAVTVLAGQSGTNDMGVVGEGTALLEIVHTIAPGAQLYFATGFAGEANFAQNIQNLAAAGCTIIVDDLLYEDESPFQDGIVAQAIDAVSTNGVLYFSAAGNEGNVDSGTAATWEGDFVDGGAATGPVGGKGGNVHSFGSANYNTVEGINEVGVVLMWSDPLGGSGNDYDLFVLDPTGTTVLSSSTNFQNGDQDPYEMCTAQASNQVVIVKASGADRFLHLGLLANGSGRLAIATTGAIRGHPAAQSVFAVSATDAGNSYPNAFTGGTNNPAEYFAADGPRRIFYYPNGTPITPGNVSSTGGTVLQKPDLTAADRVTTDAPGFEFFRGTSAAAPHAAAIAALLESYNATLPPHSLPLTLTQITNLLISTALDAGTPGVDRDCGYGIVMALAAMQGAGSLAIAPFTITAVAREGNNIRVTWQTLSGTTNVLQAVNGDAGNGFSNNYADITSPMVITGSGRTTTNYLDEGGAVSAQARFYRVRTPSP